MKKILLSSVGALALLTTSAFAETTDGLTLEMGGLIKGQIGIVDTDASGVELDDADFRGEGELDFTITGAAEAFTYGAFTRLNTSADDNDNVDEAYLFFESNYGRVTFGDQVGASDDYALGAPQLGYERNLDGDYKQFLAAARTAGVSTVTPATKLVSEDFAGLNFNQNSTKIKYQTPEYNGASMAISFSPKASQSGKQVSLRTTSLDTEDLIEVGAGWAGAVAEGVDLKVAAAYIEGSTENLSGAAFRLNDVQAWQLGSQVSYDAYSFGASYIDFGDSRRVEGSDSEVSELTLGFGYERGPWGAVASYALNETDNGAAGKVKGETWLVGGEYAATDNLTFTADLVMQEGDDNFDENKVFMSSARLSF